MQESLRLDAAPEGVAGDRQRLQTLAAMTELAALRPDARMAPFNELDHGAIALFVLRTVIDNLGLTGFVQGQFLDGITVDELSDELAAHIGEQLSVLEHDLSEVDVSGYARSVVGRLLNQQDRRKFRSRIFTGAGYEAFQFHILFQAYGPEGKVIVAPSEVATNLYFVTLPTAIEDAQIALTQILASQLERGLIDRAISTAEQQTRLRRQHAAMIKQLGIRVLSAVRSLRWQHDLQPKIAEVREQIDLITRTYRTSPIDWEVMRSKNEQAIDKLTRVRKAYEECRALYENLYTATMRLQSDYIDQMERYALKSRLVEDLRHPVQDIFQPLIGLPISALDETGLAAAAMPPRLPQFMDAGALISWALRPPRLRDEEPAKYEEPVLEMLDEEKPRLLPADEKRAAAFIRDVGGDEGVALSCILEVAQSRGLPDLEIKLLVIYVLMQFKAGAKSEWNTRNDGGTIQLSIGRCSDIFIAPAGATGERRSAATG